MALSPDDYRRQLSDLAPPGQALHAATDSKWQQLLHALAGLFGEVDARAEALMTELDPREARDLLSDWERVTGLPDTCVPGAQTEAERRDGVMRVLTSTGGQSREYYIEMAAELGYEITITEHHPHSVDDTVDYPVNGGAWQFAWTVRAAGETVRYLTTTSDVSEALATWGNDRLECVIERYKPAHTYVIFAYGST